MADTSHPSLGTRCTQKSHFPPCHAHTIHKPRWDIHMFTTLPLGCLCLIKETFREGKWVHISLNTHLFVVSLKTLLGKSNGTKSSLRKKEYNEYSTPPDEDYDLYSEVFAFQFCVPSSQELRLVKIWWINLLDYHLNKFVVYQYHSSFVDYVWKIILVKCITDLSWAMQATLSSKSTVGTLTSYFKPHLSLVKCITDLNHTHSLLASWIAIISAWFEEVATIDCFVDRHDIAVPPYVNK